MSDHDPKFTLTELALIVAEFYERLKEGAQGPDYQRVYDKANAALKNRHADAGGTSHRCHWNDCEVSVPPSMWGCRQHWFMLPRSIRLAIRATYRAGQEIDKRPSPAYLKAARDARVWITDYLQRNS